jgi:hypothetical protein
VQGLGGLLLLPPPQRGFCWRAVVAFEDTSGLPQRVAGNVAGGHWTATAQWPPAALSLAWRGNFEPA